MARIPRIYSTEERAYLKHVGIHLRQARLTARLSQEEVADRAGLSRSHISKIESALYDPQITTLLRISAAVNLDLKDLILAYPFPSYIT